MSAAEPVHVRKPGTRRRWQRCTELSCVRWLPSRFDELFTVPVLSDVGSLTCMWFKYTLHLFLLRYEHQGLWRYGRLVDRCWRASPFWTLHALHPGVAWRRRSVLCCAVVVLVLL